MVFNLKESSGVQGDDNSGFFILNSCTPELLNSE